MRLVALLLVGLLGCEAETGPKGAEGDPGPPGAPGQDGAAVAKGDPGEPGEDGLDGTDGTDGDPGDDGQQGAQGMPGPEGEPGPGLSFVDATSTELPVRFIGSQLVYFDSSGDLWNVTSGSPNTTCSITQVVYSGPGCTGTERVALQCGPFAGSTFSWAAGETRALSPTATQAAMAYNSIRYLSADGTCQTEAGFSGGYLLSDTHVATPPAGPIFTGVLQPVLN